MAGQSGYALGVGWRGLLREVGVDAAVVLRRANLPADLLHQEQARVSPEAFFRFFEAVDASVPGPEFWVDLVEAMSAEWFSPPLFAALCSPNLIVACERIARFKPLVGPVELTFETDRGGLHLTYRWTVPTMEPPTYLQGIEAMFAVRLARMGTRHPVRPTQVLTSHLPPDAAPFETFLGTSFQRGSDGLQISFSLRDAQRPFLTANDAMWRIFEPELRRRLDDLQGNASFEERTRAVLLEALPSGQSAMEPVARRLAVSSRTLQRRLREEGTTFKEVVRATRESLARHYLRHTQLTATEIAFLLGFEEPTSFFRAFHRWTGATPETLRQTLVDSTQRSSFERGADG
ncbi:MAG: AraC family transcriptional regulator ligand-binding domain-containing protein [Myxococcota bacterium]